MGAAVKQHSSLLRFAAQAAQCRQVLLDMPEAAVHVQGTWQHQTTPCTCFPLKPCHASLTITAPSS